MRVFIPNNKQRNSIIAATLMVGTLTISPSVFARAQQEQMADLEARVGQLERLTDNKVMFDVLQKIEALQQDVQSLRDQAERNAHELETQNKRQKELYLDTDRRLLRLEGGGYISPSATDQAPPLNNRDRGSSLTDDEINDAPVIAPSVSSPSSSPSTSAAQDDGQPDGEYESYNYAFTQIKNGQYEQSIDSLQQFLVTYPTSSYAANAQYWLAEANYVLQRYDTAATEFRKVTDNYASSAKVSDAMLKLGYTYYELTRWQEARDILKLTTVRYSGSDQAQKAQQRLDRMAQEGR